MTPQSDERLNPTEAKLDLGRFLPAAIILGILILWGVLSTEQFGVAANAALAFTLEYFGFFYLMVTALFLGFVLVINFTSIGKVKLGGENAEPEFTYIQWFAMALCAGIAIGILFWGVAEPLYHFYYPPAGFGLEAETPAAGVFSMTISWIHWALHPYAIYSFFGVSIAYATYNLNLPFRVSSALYPLIGDRIHGPIGKFVDAVAIIAIIGSISTSLGFGTMQLASGLEYIFGLQPNIFIYLVTIVLITAAYTISSITGLKRGIRFLSQQNLRLFLIMLVYIIIIGPTLFQLNLFSDSLGEYIVQIIPFGLMADAFDTTEGWMGGWTIFYWAWWAAAAPIVGMFLARCSYGRTIREFMMINIVTPAVFGMIWFNAFGGSAIYLEHFGNAGLMEAINTYGVEIALFELFQHYPLSMLFIILGFIAVAISFITLADSMTSSIAIMTTSAEKDELDRFKRDEAPVMIKTIWGVLLGGVTVVLLLVGTLDAVQTSSVVGALPIFIIGFLIFISMIMQFTGISKYTKSN